MPDLPSHHVIEKGCKKLLARQTTVEPGLKIILC